MKKIAYIILAHFDGDQLKKLVDAINYQCDIYIHINLNSDISEFKERISLPNVKFIDERVRVSWAGISMVDAIFHLIANALERKHEYSHIVLLTGSCYPIKDIKTIYNFFIERSGKNLLKFFDGRESPSHLQEVTQKWFKEPFIHSKNELIIFANDGIRFILNKIKLKNKWDKDLIPYFGHTWCALTPETCEYIYNFHIKNPEYRKMNRHTMAPDEHYFHTIIANSPLLANSTGIAEFRGQKLHNYTNFHLTNSHTGNFWWTIDDWPLIENSDKLFIRKVKSGVSDKLIEKINIEIHGKN